MSAFRNIILAVVAASAVTACQSTEIRRCEWKPKDPRYLQSSNCCNKNDPGPNDPIPQ